MEYGQKKAAFIKAAREIATREKSFGVEVEVFYSPLNDEPMLVMKTSKTNAVRSYDADPNQGRQITQIYDLVHQTVTQVLKDNRTDGEIPLGTFGKDTMSADEKQDLEAYRAAADSVWHPKKLALVADCI